MNVKELSFLLFFAFTVGGCASEPPPLYAHRQNILGVWDCNQKFEEEGFSMKIESKETFLRNGSGHSFGIMKAKFASNLPEIDYSVAVASTWSIEGKYLAVAGAECNTVIELKLEHHAA